MNNNLSNSDFYKIQDSFRKHQGDYNIYVQKIEKPEEKKVKSSFWVWLKGLLGIK